MYAILQSEFGVSMFIQKCYYFLQNWRDTCEKRKGRTTATIYRYYRHSTELQTEKEVRTYVEIDDSRWGK